MTSTTTKLAAETLNAAERDGPVADLPAEARPETVADAYAIQDARMVSPDKIGGWKVTVVAPGEEPVCAPVAKSRHYRSGDRYVPSRFHLPLIEVEIAVKIARDLPRRATPYGADDILAAVAATVPALELVGSRYIDRKALPPLTVLADCQSNEGTAFGDGISGLADIDFATAKVSAAINRQTTQTVETGADKEGIIRTLVWLANHTAARCGGLLQGQIILTGARIRPFAVGSGDRVSGCVAGLGEVFLDIA